MILLAKKILFQDSSDECPDYPCEAIWEKENRYQEKYVLKESPIQNLKEIHEVGMQTFLQRQKQRFACPACSDIISVHTGKCRGCSYDASSASETYMK